jgi:hypothetical protein
MLTKQFFVEFRRLSGFFTGLAIINLILTIISFLPYVETVAKYICPFYLMIAFTLAMIYIFIDLFNDFYLGKNTLLLMIPVSEIKLISTKSLVYFIGIFMLWLTNLVEVFFSKTGLYQTAIISSDRKVEGIFYLFLSRISGIFSGIAIFVLCIAIIRLTRSKFFAYILSFAIFMVCMISFCIFILEINGCFSGKNDWSIGINTDVHVYNQYIGFIPIMIFPSNNFDISKTINWNNTIINFLIGTFIYAISAIILKFKKYDYLEK